MGMEGWEEDECLYTLLKARLGGQDFFSVRKRRVSLIGKVSPYLQGEHHFPALLRVYPMVTFHQNVSPQTKPAEVHGELASVRHGIEIGGVDRSEPFVDLEERSTTGGLEQRNTEDGEMR